MLEWRQSSRGTGNLVAPYGKNCNFTIFRKGDSYRVVYHDHDDAHWVHKNFAEIDEAKEHCESMVEEWETDVEVPEEYDHSEDDCVPAISEEVMKAISYLLVQAGWTPPKNH